MRRQGFQMRHHHTIAALACTLALACAPVCAQEKQSEAEKRTSGRTIALLEGGRRIDFVRTISSEQELHLKRGIFNRALDIVAGAPRWHKLVRPYAVTSDSHGRLIISDPGALAVHIFDFQKQKYTSIAGGKDNAFKSPIGLAVDAEDNIYVTDSELGKILVFDARGKYRRVLGDIKGEGFYKRPTGLAIDREAKRMYVTDTVRNRIYITDLEGQILKDFGARGTEDGQFNFPTELFLRGDRLYVVDAMNFRIQVFDKDGNYKSQFGKLSSTAGGMFRPKGLGVDSEGNIYLVDAALEAVQVFNREGQLLFIIGGTGTTVGRFTLPSGIWIDGANHIFVADSYNRRVQVFQYTASQTASAK